MKKTKKLLSAAIALSMSVGTSALFPFSANAAAVNWDSYLEHSQEWMPKDFESAMDFFNSYGSTKVENDTICILMHVPDSYKMKADIKPSSKSDELKADSEYESHIYTFDFELPKEPDKSDAKAYANYLEEIERLQYTSIYASGSVGFHYEALVILNNTASGFDVDVSLEGEDDEVSDSFTYSFEKTDDGLTETDIYGWLPDSVSEFGKYVKEYGNISFKDGMMVYADTVNYSTGAALDIKSSGSGKLKDINKRSLRIDELIEPTGRANFILNLYKGETEGDVEMTFTKGRPWDTEAEDHKSITVSVHVDENLNVSENVEKEVPEWIPQDSESAVEFMNEHGSSFVNDGVICLVRKMSIYSEDSCFENFSGSAAKKISDYEVFNQTIKCSEESAALYKVMAYDIPQNSDIAIDFMHGHKEAPINVSSYSFKKDDANYITQTDKYAWLPDCQREFHNYFEKHGAFSIQAGYVMYCCETPVDYSCDIVINQSGSGKFIEEHQERIRNAKSVDGGSIDYIKLFKPIDEGTVKLDITQDYPYNKELDNITETAVFNIDKDMYVTPAEESELKTTIEGDCNGDGEFGISDAVTLRNWLLGKNKLPEYGIADVNGDGSVDVFDLIAIRKKLVENVKDEPRPVMVIINENYAWSAVQNATIIDQYGSAYKFKYENKLYDDWKEVKNNILKMDSENWYDKIAEIMASSPASADYIPDSAMTKINKFAENAEVHSKEKVSEYTGACDFGLDSVYIIGKNADGNPVNAKLAEYGDWIGWIETDEVRTFIKMLDSYDIFGGNVINALENGYYS